MLLYSVCYYYGKNKNKNILDHIIEFNKIKKKDDIFILTVMIDSKDNKIHNKVKTELSKFIESYYKINYKILTSYNWGGTILGLWITYQYGKCYDNAYIAHFEEDFLSINNNWLKDIKKILDLNNDYIYIGESNYQHPIYKNRGIIKHAMNCRGQNKIKNKQISDKIGNMTSHGCGKNITNCIKHGTCGGLIPYHQVWTDGGMYFSTIEKLKLIEEKVGIFHKGDKNTKWNHNFDGIELGEVGFPTLLYHSGFRFSSISRKNYFRHN